MRELFEEEAAPEALRQPPERIEEEEETAPMASEPLETQEQSFHNDLLEKLNHRSSQVREAAVKAAMSLPSEQVLELVRQEAAYHRKQFRRILWVTGAGYGTLTIGSLLFFPDLLTGCAVIAGG